MRIRDNQRRSRARKQEYISELESKVSKCEASLKTANLDHIRTVQRLERENAKLRGLLTELQVSPEFVQQYVEADAASETGSKIAIAPLRKESPKEAKATQKNMSSSSIPAVSRSPCCPGRKSCHPAGSDDVPDPVKQKPAESTHSFQWGQSQTSLLLEALCCSEPRATSTDLVEGTTPCSTAVSLLQQYNTQGLDMWEIGARLLDGFRRGAQPGDGCRVQTQLLFDVLNEISSGLS